jgi:hypothetical protein
MPGPLMQLQGHGYYLSGKYNCGRFCAGCKNCKNDKEEAEDKNASVWCPMCRSIWTKEEFQQKMA